MRAQSDFDCEAVVIEIDEVQESLIQQEGAVSPYDSLAKMSPVEVVKTANSSGHWVPLHLEEAEAEVMASEDHYLCCSKHLDFQPDPSVFALHLGQALC